MSAKASTDQSGQASSSKRTLTIIKEEACGRYPRRPTPNPRSSIDVSFIAWAPSKEGRIGGHFRRLGHRRGVSQEAWLSWSSSDPRSCRGPIEDHRADRMLSKEDGDFAVALNPEPFARHAVHDFNPPRFSGRRLRAIGLRPSRHIDAPIVHADAKVAELIKYVNNLPCAEDLFCQRDREHLQSPDIDSQRSWRHSASTPN
jgi:hypothetical protein